jgi:hypothetical protein
MIGCSHGAADEQMIRQEGENQDFSSREIVSVSAKMLSQTESAVA